jgi:integrase
LSLESSSLSSGTKNDAFKAPEGAFLLSESLPGVKNGVSFKDFRKLCMAKRNLLFKPPTIIRNKSGDWYIQYYFRSPATGKWAPHKTRGGINYIKDPVEKEREAALLAKDVLAWLKAGNSPYDVMLSINSQVVDREAHVEAMNAKDSIWSLGTALDEYIAYILSKGHTPSTLNTYKRYVKGFRDWLVENNLLDQKACVFTEMDAQSFLDDLYEAKAWSPRTFNNYMEFMVTLFTRLRKLEKTKTKNRSLKYDFEPEDLELKISKPQVNKALSPPIFERVKEELKGEGFADLRDYLEWIYLSLMRPDEIRHLKVRDIDLENRQMRIVGKTGDRLIPISDQLLALIERRKAMAAGIDVYMFGYKGAVDKRRMSVAYFLDKWQLIRDKVGLDFKYRPYSYKPTGVIKMIKAGFSDAEIMVLTGHKTVTAFEAYKRDLVIDNKHLMKGKTIDF